MTGFSRNCYIHILYFNEAGLNGPLLMVKVFEVYILYMDMVASFGHVIKLICWNLVSDPT